MELWWVWVCVHILNIYSCLFFLPEFHWRLQNRIWKYGLGKKQAWLRHYLAYKLFSCILNYKEKLVYILCPLDIGVLLQVFGNKLVLPYLDQITKRDCGIYLPIKNKYYHCTFVCLSFYLYIYIYIYWEVFQWTEVWVLWTTLTFQLQFPLQGPTLKLTPHYKRNHLNQFFKASQPIIWNLVLNKMCPFSSSEESVFLNSKQATSCIINNCCLKNP